MSPSPIRVGFVGLSATGWASAALAPSLLSLRDKYSLTAVSTTSDESSKASAQKLSDEVGHQVKAYHGDTSHIANDPDVDLVAIAVKAPTHKAAVLPAIEAGKDVFIEWPAGVGLKETTEIADAARKKGIRTMVGLQGRHSSTTRKVKELLDSGAIGKVLSCSVIALAPRELGYWGPNVGERNTYTVQKAGGASMLHIAMGHQLDTLTYLLGDFASVNATTAIHYPNPTVLDADNKPTNKTFPAETADQVAFTGILKSGAVTSIIWRGGYSSTKGREQLLWIIDGEEGSISMKGDELAAAFVQIKDPKLYLNGELVDVEARGQGGLIDNLTNAWSEYAKGESGEYATMEDAVRNHRLIDGIERSVMEGRRVALE